MSRMNAAALKPPLPKSPIRLRSRRVLRSTSTSLQTPPASLTKSAKPNRVSNADGAKLRPDYYSLSSEFDALTQMVNDQIGKMASSRVGSSAGNFSASADSSDLFERGRFYDAYSARRNERLKRKKCQAGDDIETMKTPNYHLGVNVVNSKKRDTKKLESLKKSVSAAYSVDRTQNSRYMLRSLSKDKENNKPNSSSMMVNKIAIGTPSVSGSLKMTTRRVRKI